MSLLLAHRDISLRYRIWSLSGHRQARHSSGTASYLRRCFGASGHWSDPGQLGGSRGSSFSWRLGGVCDYYPSHGDRLATRAGEPDRHGIGCPCPLLALGVTKMLLFFTVERAARIHLFPPPTVNRSYLLRTPAGINRRELSNYLIESITTLARFRGLIGGPGRCPVGVRAGR